MACVVRKGPPALREAVEAMNTPRRGRESGAGSGRPPFEGGQLRLRFGGVADGDVRRRLLVDKVAGPRPAPTLWREVDACTGAPEIVCPACWPEMAVRLRDRPGVEVRLLDGRPEWARCAVCDPEPVC